MDGAVELATLEIESAHQGKVLAGSRIQRDQRKLERLTRPRPLYLPRNNVGTGKRRPDGGALGKQLGKPTTARNPRLKSAAPGLTLNLKSPLLKLDKLKLNKKKTESFLRRYRSDPKLKPFLRGGKVELFKVPPRSTRSLFKDLRDLGKAKPK